MGGFSVEGKGASYHLVHETYKKVELDLESPMIPKILKTHDHHNFLLVILDHGDVGTSCLVRIHKAYVFDKKKKAFIGEYPYGVQAKPNEIKTCKVEPIKWEFYKNYILVHDHNSEKKYKIESLK